MTVQAYPEAQTWTVNGTGPYSFDFEVLQAEDVVLLVQTAEGQQVPVDAEDYTVTLASLGAGGNVTLTSAAADELDGLTITIARGTEVQQGWVGLLGEREKGLEQQLDRLTMGLQEVQRTTESSLKLTVPAPAMVALPGRALIFDETGAPVPGPTAEDIAAAGEAAALAVAAAEAAAVFDPSQYLDRASFDPQGIGDDAFARANHTGTQAAATITGLGELATRNRATVAQIRSLDADAAPTAERISEAAALITPSGAANWAPDWTAFLSASWVLTGNRTLQNPTNVIPGTTRVVRAAGNSGTGRTISFGSNYKGDRSSGPVTDDAPILYTLFAATPTEIWVSSMEADP